MTSFIIGVDGCPTGWVGATINSENEFKIEFFSTVQKLWNSYPYTELILIDIPIGLRDKGKDPRLCDMLARKFLTRMRSSSIFPTPCRRALYANSYMQANEINKKNTGKGLSKQTWNIMPKIREVDRLLQNDENSRSIFLESHPEMCFMALNDATPMSFYKKSNEGINERLTLLKSHCKISKKSLKEHLIRLKRNKVSLDDILDAFVLAVSAAKGKSNLQMIPEKFEYDSIGLPMRMAIPSLKKKFEKYF